MSLRAALAAAALIAFSACASAADAPQAFDKAGWLADLRQLRDAMSAHYANLEWAVSDRGLDLPAVYARAQHGIEAATDNQAAQAAFNRFVRTFGDGHFEIRWQETASAGAAAASTSLCDRLGYFDVGESGGVATRLKGFVPLRGTNAPDIPAGLLMVSGKRVAVLRLPMFGPQGFPDICTWLLESENLKPDSPCDDACQDRLSDVADRHYMAEVTAQLRALIHAKPDVLLVDLAGNGGGNDTANAIARMVTGKTLRMPRMGFVRDPRWAQHFVDDRKIIETGIASAAGTERDFLTHIDLELESAQSEAIKTCDRDPLWEGHSIGCSAIVIGPLYAGGYLPRELAATYRHKAWAETLSATATLDYTPGLWRGPLIVLVDHNTASASELFAAMLQDAHAALIIGAPTYGAGCGHALPEQDLVLTHSGAHVSMPDCLRLRADGRNEIDGIDPDELIGFRDNDTPAQQVRRLTAVLPSAVTRVLARD